MVCGFAAMVWGLRQTEAPAGLGLTFTGIVVDLGAAVVTCLSIRCPHCGMRWIWIAVKSQEHLRWINWLIAQRVCPGCDREPSADKCASETLPFREEPDQDDARIKVKTETKRPRS